MKDIKQLTQAKFDEKWEVTVGRDKFCLNEKQIVILKDAMEKGNRGVIWFSDMAISIAHIVSISLISKKTKSKFRLSSLVPDNTKQFFSEVIGERK